MPALRRGRGPAGAAAASGSPAAAAATSASVVDQPDDRRTDPRASVAVDAERGEHVRRVLGAARAARPGGGEHPVVVLEEEQQRLAVHLGQAEVDDAGHEVVGRRRPRARRCRPRPATAGAHRIHQLRRASARRAPHRSARSPAARSAATANADSTSDVLGAAAPIALLSAADELRLRSARRRAPRGRRRPSARRTCARPA